jgi:hypothetical protein
MYWLPFVSHLEAYVATLVQVRPNCLTLNLDTYDVLASPDHASCKHVFQSFLPLVPCLRQAVILCSKSVISQRSSYPRWHICRHTQRLYQLDGK